MFRIFNCYMMYTLAYLEGRNSGHSEAFAIRKAFVSSLKSVPPQSKNGF